MQGFLETLVEATFLRGLGPGLAVLLLAAAPRRTGRVELKKIFVLNDTGEMTSEYSLDADCPIDYNDFLRVLPPEGIGDRESLFVGEYVFTAFQSAKTVFVLLSRGKLNPEDFDWIALLLRAAYVGVAGARGPAADPAAQMAAEASLAEREARLQAREAELTKLEVRLKADEANLRGRAEELDRQQSHVSALAERASQMERQAAAIQGREASNAGALAEAEQRFTAERSTLQAANADLERKVRHGAEQLEEATRARDDAIKNLERERAEWTRRDAEATRMRAEIEKRVQELSQRFASMARDRLVNPAAPPSDASEAAKRATELEKAQLAKERKFLQTRAIEILNNQEAVQERERRAEDRERKAEIREGELRKREEALVAREAEIRQARAQLEQAASAGPSAAGAPDDMRKELERRVKLIQQKALDLIDREESLRKRAEELRELEDRLAGRIPAK